MSKVIGIDLGTTNCCVSIMDGKNSKLLKTQKGQEQPLLLLVLVKMVKKL
jgi:molecular chaperone DnaK (HSP70)